MIKILKSQAKENAIVYSEVMTRNTKIPLDKLVEIIKSTVFYIVLENNYDMSDTNFIETSIDIASAFNSYLNGVAIFKPVVSAITTDQGDMNPVESIVIEVNGLYYDLTNKIYDAKLISRSKLSYSKKYYDENETDITNRLCPSNIYSVLKLEIKKIYLENFLNTVII